MIKESSAPAWPMLVFDFWVVSVVFSLGWHDTDTYRTVSTGHGAFELCLPSLGFLFTKLVLRTQRLGQACHMTKVRVGAGHGLSANTMPWGPYMYRPNHAHRMMITSQNINCFISVCIVIAAGKVW